MDGLFLDEPYGEVFVFMYGIGFAAGLTYKSQKYIHMYETRIDNVDAKTSRVGFAEESHGGITTVASVTYRNKLQCNLLMVGLMTTCIRYTGFWQ